MMALKRRIGGLHLAVIVALTLVLLATAAQAMEMKGWMVAGAGPGIMEGQRYSLYNIDQRLYLEEKDRWGANLSWDSKPNNFMMVKRIGPGSGPIKCGETFGVFVEKEWIMYDSQTWSINISTRKNLGATDEYKWQFTNCQAGAVVPFNTQVGLWNLKVKDSLVGCKRVLGVNLCWANDVGHYGGKNYRKADAAKVLGPLVKLLPIPAPLLEGARMVASRDVEGTIEEERSEKPLPSQEDLIADKLAEAEVLSRGVDPPTGGGN